MKNMPYFVLFLVLFIRVLLFSLPSFKIDMTDWQAWTSRLIEVGPSSFYSPNYFADYFPGYLYILLILGKAFLTLFPNSSLFSTDFIFILKGVTTIFDLGTAYLIYKIVKKYRPKVAIFASILYLGNPALIFNSSIWGQIDGILTFFLLLSIYFLIEVKNFLFWSISFAFAFLVKPQTISILPISLIYLFKEAGSLRLFKLVFLSIILSVVISLPFFINTNPVFGIFELFQKTASGYQYTSLYTLNIWSLIGWWKDDNTKWYFLSYQSWGIIFYLNRRYS